MFRSKYLAGALLLALSSSALADKYNDTVALFQNAGDSNAFFSSAYGYAVFPTIAKAGFGVGGARGKGKVFGCLCVYVFMCLGSFNANTQTP